MRPSGKSIVSFVAACAVAGTTGATARAADVPGSAVVAIATEHALIIWDATQAVTTCVADRLSGAAAQDRIEREALSVLANSIAKVPAARSIAVRVVYTKSGAVSPLYGSATFAGVERYATLTMTAIDARSDRNGWEESAAGVGPLPKWIEFTPSGVLPAR